MRAFFRRLGRPATSKEAAGNNAVSVFPGRKQREAALTRRDADKFSEQIKDGVRFATHSYEARITESRKRRGSHGDRLATEDYAASA